MPLFTSRRPLAAETVLLERLTARTRTITLVMAICLVETWNMTFPRHNALCYFCRRSGEDVYGVVPGVVSTSIELNSSDSSSWTGTYSLERVTRVSPGTPICLRRHHSITCIN